MKVSTLKSIITKSAHNLHARALDLAINSDAEEKLLQNYATIERSFEALKRRLSDDQLEWMLSNVEFDWSAVKALKDAQSREFYKRLANYVIFATSGQVKERPLGSLLLDVQSNGLKDSYRVTGMQSIFGHKTATQAQYFGNFLKLTHSGSYKTLSSGNELRIDWNSPLFQAFQKQG